MNFFKTNKKTFIIFIFTTIIITTISSCNKNNPTAPDNFDDDNGSSSKNTTPVISSFTSDPTSGSSGETVDLSVNASDADGDTLTYTFEVQSGTGTLSGSDTADGKTYTLGSVGTEILKVTVSDGDDSVSKTLSIDVLADIDISMPLVLNELSGNDQGPNNEDFIEIYNTNGSPYDISSNQLLLIDDKDDPTNDDAFIIPPQTVDANSFLLLEKVIDFEFGLGGSGDEVNMYYSSNNGASWIKIASYSYTSDEDAFGRFPDGSGSWRSVTPTPGSNNTTNIQSQTSGDYTYLNGEITAYNGTDTVLTIPDTIEGQAVVSIGYRVFRENTDITEVTLPDSVTNIGEEAFEKASSLTSITLGSAVEIIGKQAFKETGLTSVVIPANVTNIGEEAFKEVSSLTNVIFESTTAPVLSSEGDGVFAGTDGSLIINVPNGSSGYSGGAWDSLTINITGGGSLPEITSFTADKETLLTNETANLSLSSSDSDGTIVTNTFEVTSPNSHNASLNQTSITAAVFSASSEGSYTIQASARDNDGNDVSSNIIIIVTNGGGDAVSEYDVLNGVITNYRGSDSILTIPDTIEDQAVVSIGDRAFRENTDITEVTLPDSVTNIGEEAFEKASSLTSITLGSAVEVIGKQAFKESGLTSVTLPDSVTSLGEEAFETCSDLTSVSIGSDVTVIEKQTFKETGLTSVVIPANVTEIGEEAFKDVSSLTNIVFESTTAPVLSSAGDGVFAGTDGSLIVNVPAGSTGYSGGAWDSLTVNITGGGSLPEITSFTADKETLLTNETANFSLSSSDSDGTIVTNTFEVTSPNSHNASLNQTSITAAVFSASSEGSYTIQASARDNDGNDVSSNIVIIVTNGGGFTPVTPPALLINEIDADNGGPDGEDFIELINTESTNIEIAADTWYITDDPTDPNTDDSLLEVLASKSLAADGFYLAQKDSATGADSVFTFGLGSDEGAYLYYKQADGSYTAVDNKTYTGKAASWGRYPDGGSWIDEDALPTPGSANTVPAAGGLSFTDTDTDSGEIGGDLIITASADETHITAYVIYFSDDGTSKTGSSVASEVPTGSDITVTISDDTALGSHTHFVVYVETSDGECAEGIFTEIHDSTFTPVTPPALLINEIDADSGGPDGEDFIELINTESTNIEIAADTWYITDDPTDPNTDDSALEGLDPKGSLAADGFYLAQRDIATGVDSMFTFGLGSDEGAYLYYKQADGSYTAVDSKTYTGKAASWGRYPDGENWIDEDVSPTPGSANTVPAAGGLSFTDTDTDSGEIGGDLIITASADETHVTAYVIYFSDDGSSKAGSSVASETPTGSDITVPISDNTTIGSHTHFVVYVETSDGECAEGVFTEIHDSTFTPVTPPALLINEIDADSGGPDGEDFIELINTESTNIEIAADTWYITDDPTDPNTDDSLLEVLASKSLAADGFYLAQKDSATGADSVFTFGLGSDEGAYLYYKQADGSYTAVDSKTYTGKAASWGRYPDGGSWIDEDALPTPGSANNAPPIFSEDFENPGSYVPSITEFSDDAEDYFGRAEDNGDNPNIIGVDSSLSADVDGVDYEGDHYFIAEDIDGEGATLPVNITFTNIDISGKNNLMFKIDIASATPEGWEGPDFVKITCDIDNSGSWQDVIEIRGDAGDVPALDTDFDGEGDGTLLTSSFQTFGQSITGTGSTIDIKIDFYLNSGDEEVALDNLFLIGE